MTDQPRRLPYDLAVYQPNQTPYWIIRHWADTTIHPLAPITQQPAGFVAPWAQHRLIQVRPDYVWVGRAAYFVIGVSWLVRSVVCDVAVDGVETIDLPTNETNADLAPLLGISYSEVRLPAGQISE